MADGASPETPASSQPVSGHPVADPEKGDALQKACRNPNGSAISIAAEIFGDGTSFQDLIAHCDRPVETATLSRPLEAYFPGRVFEHIRLRVESLEESGNPPAPVLFLPLGDVSRHRRILGHARGAIECGGFQVEILAPDTTVTELTERLATGRPRTIVVCADEEEHRRRTVEQIGQISAHRKQTMIIVAGISADDAGTALRAAADRFLHVGTNIPDLLAAVLDHSNGGE